MTTWPPKHLESEPLLVFEDATPQALLTDASPGCISRRLNGCALRSRSQLSRMVGLGATRIASYVADGEMEDSRSVGGTAV